MVFSSGRTIGELSSMILWNIGYIINEYLKLAIEISRQLLKVAAEYFWIAIIRHVKQK